MKKELARPLEKLIAEEKKRAVNSTADGDDGDNNEEHKPAVALQSKDVKVKLDNDADAGADIDAYDVTTDNDGLTHTPANHQDRKRSRSVPCMSPPSQRSKRWIGSKN